MVKAAATTTGKSLISRFYGKFLTAKVNQGYEFASCFLPLTGIE